MTFADKTELTGHMKLRLWVAAVGTDAMDLFIEDRLEALAVVGGQRQRFLVRLVARNYDCG